MKKIVTCFAIAFFCVTAFTLSAQSLFQGPATGTSDPGAAVSTANFSAALQALASQHKLVKRPVGKHAINLVPDPPNLRQPFAPAGSNVFLRNKEFEIQQTAPTILSSFNGIDDAGNVIPPDPHMAAGPNHVMATINVEFGIWDKQGNKLFGIDADSWFDNVLLDSDPFDPQITFDHFASRWVMIWVGGNLTTEAYLMVSVSDDSDPLGTWFNWAIRADRNGDTPNNNLNDYPKLGYDANNIYVTSNQFDLNSLAFQFVQLRAIGKAQLYDGSLGSATYTDFWDLRDPDNLTVGVFTVIPAVHLDADVEGSAFLINDSPFVTGTTATIWEVTDPAGAISLDAANVAVTSSSEPPDAEQSGGGTLIDVGGRRFRNAVFRADDIWTAHSVAGGAGNSDADARYLRVSIDNSVGLAVTLEEDVALHLDGAYHSYPAIQVDNSLNMVMGYTRVSSTEFAGAFFTGRLDTDPAGTLAASTLLKAGEDNYVKTFGGSRNRWGDYMGIALDPTTGSTWMFIEYADLEVGPGTSDDRWGTWFGEVNFATDVPPTITSTPTTTATVDEAYSYDNNNTVESSGTQPITFSLVTGPTGFTVASDGLVTWTPTINDTGINAVNILASNAFGTANQTFDIVVSEAPPPSAAQFRINAGGNDFTDSNGDLFVADQAFTAGGFGFDGGASSSTGSAISGTTEDELYQNFRQGDFSYRFGGLSEDDFTVTLKFAEPFAPRAGGRTTDVIAEGIVFLDNFDIVAAAGSRFTAHDETFIVHVSDGTLDIDFVDVGGPLDPIVSAIVVLGSAPPVSEPDITVAPLSVDFGDVNLNASGDQTVTITNDGNLDLLVSSLTTTNAVFTVVSPVTPVTVTPSNSVIVTVRFSPTANGSQSGNLEITSDDPDEGLVTVALTGNGVTPVPDITVAPTSLNFGDVNINQSGDLTTTITNDGNADLNVTALTTTNALFTIVSPVTPVTIVPGGSEIVTVRFSPTAVGAQSGNLDITSDDPDEGLVTVSLTGSGVVPPPDEADISVAPLSVDFGQAITGDSSDATVTITNGGTQILTVSDLTTTNGVFTVVSPATPFDVAISGGTQDVTLRFKPTLEIIESGNLNITSNDPDQGVVTVTLTGEGIPAPVPGADFRINAGGNDFTDSFGDLFVADKEFVAGDFGFQGGAPSSTNAGISGTTDDALYQTFREGSSFSYIFDNLAAGNYQITLFFVEPFAPRANGRIFDVTVEGAIILDNFDIFVAAGTRRAAHSETFIVNVSDGQLNIDVTDVGGPLQALMCAVAVVAQSSSSAPLATNSLSAADAADELQVQIPEKFELEQNYPNPFNPETIIRYSVPANSNVILRIYNLLGQEVQTLVDEFKAPGEFNVVWRGKDEKGNDVPSGVYIYQLKGEGFINSKKMILLR